MAHELETNIDLIRRLRDPLDDRAWNEFVDRYGPRLAHLNGVLQVLSQLSSIPTATN